MFSALTSSHRLFLLVLGLVVLALLTSMMVSGAAALLVAAVLCVMALLLRPLLMPPGYGAMKVRTLSIIGVFGLAASHNFWAGLVNQAAKASAAYPLLQQYVPGLAKLHLEEMPSIAVLVFAVVGMWVVHYYMADKSIAGGHPEPLDKEFPERTFAEGLQTFCHGLEVHLVAIDRQSSWSPEHYTELEAEVEVDATNGKSGSRRIVNLQSALRSDRDTQSFLILGDPGSGKSVALRKLTIDMLAQVAKTGRVPIYINLREWLPAGGRQQAGWTEQAPPNLQQLEEFVIANIKARGDNFTEKFAEKYFRKLSDHGRLFFIFDSFDEIPELLDVNQESWLIESLSEVLTRFICSNPAGRGIVASRMFRRPTQAFQAQKILDIRPMSDERIIKAMDRYPGFNPQLRGTLFVERNDLVPIVRNPFLMTLLGEWIDDHGTLPATQLEMYSHYLRKGLGTCADKLKKHQLDIDTVLAGATDIAWFVFHSPDYGLEAPVELIGEEARIPNAAAIIGILRHARIARVTEAETPSFAFVHRRFLEYFVTTRLLTQPEAVPSEHIPTDSRGRDAMVLYAQLCDLPTAAALAIQCWAEVRSHFEHPEQRLRAIHCLRFLTDAFTARRQAVAVFADELAAFITEHVNRGSNLIQAKICLEATGVLSEDQAVPILQLALDGNNAWLQETAFRACRSLPRLSAVLQRAMEDYLINMPLRQFWRHRAGLMLSLSLSEATAGPYRVARWRAYNLQASFAAALPAICALPLVASLMFTITLGLGFVSIVFRPVQRPQARAASSPEMAAIIAIMRTDRLLQSTRLLFALGCAAVVLSTSILGMFFPSGAKTDGFWLMPILSLDPVPRMIAGLALCILVMDWYLAAAIGRMLFKLRIDKATTLALLATVAVIGTITAAVTMLQRSGFDWIVYVVYVILVAAAVLHFIFITARFALFCYRDYQIFKDIKIGDRMARAEIARKLDSLKWIRLRLALVRKLAQQRTMAHGEWPPGFALAVSGDAAITELAKLEERWLKLDR